MTQTVEAATPDFEAIKQRQQQTWASGDFSVVAARIMPIAEQLCDTADLHAGWHVLDVATGSGNAAIAAARLGCTVVGVDYVPELLERGRMRAAAEGLAIELLEGDAEALPFADESFDAVTSVFGSMFAPNHQQAASELLRVSKPGGTIALASWTPDGFIGELFKTVGAARAAAGRRAVAAALGDRAPPAPPVRRRSLVARGRRADLHVQVSVGGGLRRRSSAPGTARR